MNIILANPRGFCAGVNMAVECVERVLQLNGPPVYVFHEIVHNRHVVEDFQKRGVVFVDRVEEVPVGQLVVYSAHGISPEVRRLARQRRLLEVDATCPLVMKVHLEVIRFVREGYTVVFIGHRNHDEAVGTMGEAPESMVIVESAADVEALPYPADARLAYVTQTTLSVSEAERVIAALKRRWPHIKAPPKEDICYATTNRQAAVGELAARADLVLVIGSDSSSNSRRLVETARKLGRAAYLIDDKSEIRDEWFQGVGTVLVTAGASAPEHLVAGLVDDLRQRFGGDVETQTIAREDVTFALPRTLTQLGQPKVPTS